jgi:hypothetical protein
LSPACRTELLEIAGFLVDHEGLPERGFADAHVDDMVEHEGVRAATMILQLERSIALYFAVHAAWEYPSPSALYEEFAAIRRAVRAVHDTVTHMPDGPR